MTGNLAENILNQSADPVLVLNREGVLLWSNQSAGRMLKLAEERIQHIDQILQPEQVRAVLSTEHFSITEAILTVARDRFLKQAVLVTHFGSGDPDEEYFMLSFHSTASLSERLREREDFLSTISHDLKNPLGAIFGYADVLLDTSAGERLAEEDRSVISRIRTTAARGLELVRNYQDLSQLQNIQVTPAPTAIDLRAVIENVSNTLWREDPSTAPLVLDLPTEPLPVYAAVVHVERVVSNLVGNALKYTPPDGKINVKARLTPEASMLEITNTKSVISPKELSTLFERYARGSSSQGKSGSGLGLYIVKRILDGLGATITVSSDHSVGTVFVVKFPLR